MQKSKHKDAVQVDETTGEIGFDTAPTPKPNIIGSRTDGTALTDLLTKLAAKGLITDSTTA